MSVITISRGTMSGGKLIAETLAKELDFRCIDRDVIVEKAAASGVSHEELRNALDKPPSLLDRFRHKKYLYLTLIQAALAEEVKAGVTGGDTWPVDAVPNPDPACAFCVHTYLQTRHGIVNQENLKLSELAADGVYQFA